MLVDKYIMVVNRYIMITVNNKVYELKYPENLQKNVL